MSSALNLYQSVIQDVINNVKDKFLDESVDENVLQVHHLQPAAAILVANHRRHEVYH